MVPEEKSPSLPGGRHYGWTGSWELRSSSASTKRTKKELGCGCILRAHLQWHTLPLARLHHLNQPQSSTCQESSTQVYTWAYGDIPLSSHPRYRDWFVEGRISPPPNFVSCLFSLVAVSFALPKFWNFPSVNSWVIFYAVWILLTVITYACCLK